MVSADTKKPVKVRKRKQNYHPYIDDYMDAVRVGKIKASREIKQAMNYIQVKLSNPDVFIDEKKIYKAQELIERYFEMKLLDWELFILALIHCYYVSEDTVVFDEIFLMVGRGNGKNGFISALIWYLTTQYHGVKRYNVDIVANSEEQAKTSFEDVYEMLGDTWNKSKHFFYRTKEKIINTVTKSYIKYNTANAKSKDGKRTGCLVFDEIHEYQDYNLINVFQRSFGKKKHARIFWITTNGYVRDGVLDDKLRLAEDVLNGTVTNLGLLPLIYKIDKKEEGYDPDMWPKANPSLNHEGFVELKKEMQKDLVKMKYESQIEQDFFTKRMNWPEVDREIQVTDWDNIMATAIPIPDLSGKSAVVGIDYAEISDFAAAGVLIRVGDIRYWITHSWVCRNSKDLSRIKAPLETWSKPDPVTGRKEPLLTFVSDVSIDPELISEWIAEQGKKYNLKELALDSYRLSLVKNALIDIGFDFENRKNIKMVRPSDIMKVSPVIQDCFARHLFVWGENPLMRWYTQNTKMIRQGINKVTGNMTYGKIEPKSRKTDGFMALVAAMTLEEELEEQHGNVWNLDVYTYN